MKSVSTFDLRDNLAEYLAMVSENETPIVVNRFGKPIAVLSPYKEGKYKSYSDFFGFMGKGEKGETFLKKIRRSNKEKIFVERYRNRK